MFEDLRQSTNPKIAILIDSLAEFIGKNAMLAYLVNMTARLIGLHRVLKQTGSLWLHCDPTASHYLKVILDTIFGTQNYRNEIIWHYGQRTAFHKSHFSRKHDIIFFYAKSNKTILYPVAVTWTREEFLAHRHDVKVDEKGREFIWTDGGKPGVRYKRYVDEVLKEGKPLDTVWDIPLLNSASKERLGYPTQKPEALLERIIKASTKEDDWVLDPFCGCGTTVAVAERLNRQWVGIDISVLAINVIADRLRRHYPGIKLKIDGIPTDYESARKLADTDKFAFQDWAISLIGAYPPSGEARKGADRGVDGLILFRERASFANPKPHLRKILVQVKGGTRERKDIATLKGDMERDNAPMGVFITMSDPTPEMKREANLAGEYRYSETTAFPKVQILSITDWFAGRKPVLPSDTINPFGKAEVKAGQEELF